MPIIIDRRKNPSKKSLTNRQRFMDRFRDRIKDAARRHVGDRSIGDNGDQEITLPGEGTDEPRFSHRADSGEWDYVLPGNQEYLPGDTIDKPKKNGGKGKGNSGGRGRGEDEFRFLLSYDEFLDMIFDDLELPDLIKSSEKTMISHQLRRAGFTTAGVPSNLNIERTAVAGLGRRIALRGPKTARIAELEKEMSELEQLGTLTEENTARLLEIREEIQRLKIMINAVSYLDRVDLRYNNFVQQPRPITQAVMFCVMDVSYSMGEREKIIAKKFFILLHLFLKRRYENIEVVFIRHHEEAEECDEETFFSSRESGGTMVSSAYESVEAIIRERYPASDWNIYLAQASDGDNYSHDNKRAGDVLDDILGAIQFMAYIEITRQQTHLLLMHTTNLWDTIESAKEKHQQVSMQRIDDETDVVSVFRKFFSKGER